MRVSLARKSPAEAAVVALAEEGTAAHQAVVPEVSAAVEAKAAEEVREGLAEPAEGRAAPAAQVGLVEVEEAPEEQAEEVEGAARGRRSTRTIRTITRPIR